MQIERITPLQIPEIKTIKFKVFEDIRGYFTETFRQSQLSPLINSTIVQANESRSIQGTLRGLHFQWNPYMGKLVRSLEGEFVDLVLDIRLGSPTFGKIVTHTLNPLNQEWIWVPPGFAHGMYALTDCKMEYLCTGEYNQSCEAGIHPLDLNIDWSLVGKGPSDSPFRHYTHLLLSEKDSKNPTLSGWLKDQRSENFIYGKC